MTLKQEEVLWRAFISHLQKNVCCRTATPTLLLLSNFEVLYNINHPSIFCRICYLLLYLLCRENAVI